MFLPACPCVLPPGDVMIGNLGHPNPIQMKSIKDFRPSTPAYPAPPSEAPWSPSPPEHVGDAHERRTPGGQAKRRGVPCQSVPVLVQMIQPISNRLQHEIGSCSGGGLLANSTVFSGSELFHVSTFLDGCVRNEKKKAPGTRMLDRILFDLITCNYIGFFDVLQVLRRIMFACVQKTP